MTFESLETFKTIVETGGFRAASQKLNKAQSAVSYAIKKLEEELQFPLFDRNKYRSNLTAQGRAFYQKIHIVFDSIAELKDYSYNLKKDCEPKIRMAISALLPRGPIISGLKELKWRYPQTEIELIIDVLGADLLIQNNDVDLALSDVSGSLQKMNSYSLGKISLIPVSAQNDIKNLPQVVVASSSFANNRSVGIKNKNQIWRVSEFSAKKELLEQGLGWGFMPQHMVAEELKRGDLTELSLEKNYAEIFLLTSKTKSLGQSTQLLLDYYKKHRNRLWL